MDTTGPAAIAPERHPVAIARDAIGLSREGLAFKAHVSIKTIERIERYETTPFRNTRESIARVLKRPVHELFPPAEEVAACSP